MTRCDCSACRASRAYLERNRDAVNARRRARYRANHKAARAVQNAYQATERGRELLRRSWATYRRRNKDKIAARAVVANEIERGRLVRGECVRQGPGCEGGIEAHHEDYAKPLDIVWACRKHHDELDYERFVRLRGEELRDAS